MGKRPPLDDRRNGTLQTWHATNFREYATRFTYKDEDWTTRSPLFSLYNELNRLCCYQLPYLRSGFSTTQYRRTVPHRNIVFVQSHDLPFSKFSMPNAQESLRFVIRVESRRTRFFVFVFFLYLSYSQTFIYTRVSCTSIVTTAISRDLRFKIQITIVCVCVCAYTIFHTVNFIMRGRREDVLARKWE